MLRVRAILCLSIAIAIVSVLVPVARTSTTAQASESYRYDQRSMAHTQTRQATHHRLQSFVPAAGRNVVVVESARNGHRPLNQSGQLQVATHSGPSAWLDDAATAKVPEGWGPGAANKNGVGTRWTDPGDAGNGIRIDQGNPANSQVSQQVDHVVVRSGGKVLGRDGQPIVGSIKENYDEAHIPLSEWLTWQHWNAP